MNAVTKLSVVAILCLCVGEVSPEQVETKEREEMPRTLLVQKSAPKLKAFMRKKLVASGFLMEGLATSDFELIRKGADAMILMSKEAMWETNGAATYVQDSADFVRVAQRIIKLANAKDLEGASHTYAQLTIQCVTCHRRIRSRKVVMAPRFDPLQFAALSDGSKGPN